MAVAEKHDLIFQFYYHRYIHLHWPNKLFSVSVSFFFFTRIPIKFETFWFSGGIALRIENLHFDGTRFFSLRYSIKHGSNKKNRQSSGIFSLE